MNKLSLEYWMSPRGIIVILVFTIIIGLLVSREKPAMDTEGRASTYGTEIAGAKGIYETVERLGWKTRRRLEPFSGNLDTTITYVVLAPTIPLHHTEHSTLLSAVRKGARLIFIIDSDHLTDSLRFELYHGQEFRISAAIVTGDTTSGSYELPERGLGNRFLDALLNNNQRYVSIDYEPQDGGDEPVELMWAPIPKSDEARALILGDRYHKGKIVMLSTPNLIRNGIVRQGVGAAGFIRALEWLAPRGSTVEFDEYHHGFGTHASTPSAIQRALMNTAPGRTALQIMVAGLVLLVAISIKGRELPPFPLPAHQRRSPIEHVTALAQAYQQIHATKLGLHRLLHGLRRRHPVSGISASDDHAYLKAIESRYPALADDIDVLRSLLNKDPSDRELITCGQVIARIERTLKI